MRRALGIQDVLSGACVAEGRRAISPILLYLRDMRSGALVVIETSVTIAHGYDIRAEVSARLGP